jgi:hypothetical protein
VKNDSDGLPIVLLIGSLSHLIEEELFDYKVHVIPFVPLPYCGTNDPDLVYNLYHITTWLDKVQRGT